MQITYKYTKTLNHILNFQYKGINNKYPFVRKNWESAGLLEIMKKMKDKEGNEKAGGGLYLKGTLKLKLDRENDGFVFKFRGGGKSGKKRKLFSIKHDAVHSEACILTDIGLKWLLELGHAILKETLSPDSS